jgi:prepilin-type N-terminal cleavage/methylation domain-containing protein/prepilin-type processing-associated H-X9-DG protein
MTFYRTRRGNLEGFSLIELLVVIGIIGILASLILSAVMRGKASGQKTACINNLKQLITTWKQYSTDHDDEVVSNYRWSNNRKSYIGWVHGVGHPDTAAMTNVDFLLNDRYAAFAPYIQQPEVYQCPWNRERVDGTEAIRSYSMNPFMGAFNERAFDTNYARFEREADITRPDHFFVFIDLNQKFVCFPFMILHMDRDAWHHPPATQHNHGGTLAFADGHVDYKRWRSGTTEGTSRHVSWNQGPHITQVATNDTDLAWVRDHASFRLTGQP